MPKSFHRGHQIIFLNGKWVYADTKKTIPRNADRPCGICNEPKTPEGHDPCLGVLPGVMNACCGHGNRPEAYIQFKNGVRISGFELTPQEK